MTQGQALGVLMSGASTFLTGPPGSGKTFILNKFIKLAKKSGKTIAVTASTGIAATHIGGTTIHSWSGLGIRDQLTSFDKSWLKSNERLFKRYNATDILVIDEISMLHGSRLDMVNEACKLLRNSDRPFGGLQVVLTGDLFQLPPVTRGSVAVDFAHLSQAWAELNPKICYLTEQHRQSGGELLQILEAMRAGELDETFGEILNERINQPIKGNVTRLYSHNVDVDAVNQKHLATLPGESKIYQMTSHGAKAKIEQLEKSVLAPAILELKIGAEVMFVANNFTDGFVNGSRGQVVDFDSKNQPIVQLMDNKLVTVKPHDWSLEEDGRVRAEVVQLPLRLAWAITIHKSQGMSLDAAEIDLSRTFAPGMGYVALSRLRSLDGLFLTGLNRMALELHPDMFGYDEELKRASLELSLVTDEFVEKAETGFKATVEYDKALFENLRVWRLERARADKVAPFIIAHDSLLKELASRKPKTDQQLLAISGMGKKKLATYGPEILAILG